ncbi:uncharacterized protein AC631_01437 [Debaryomyces fabryi]|uniref:Rho-GAP domain-containing protein n=1 Tax=Debaryomyces fabryi TaxID=58627 RepID=A0A0V1Q2U7_9ASCO|nr:uncharacterized protein AC631_01437 [Debaryomyces fabryi]KSA02840.1 hypothetical protein AC631_01437 [Debaryomyces fabryi]CUM46133.1 unnamed protein product [Debaryomyces fabryi]
MERIFYKTSICDPSTQLPVYIFDTSYLPSTDVISYDEFIPTLMKHLPKENYVLIMFSCGLNKISWIWGIKFLKSFLTDNNENHLDRLVKIISVHDSWFVKSITQIFKNYNTTRKNFNSLNKIVESFNIRIENFGNLTSLSNTIVHYSKLSELHNYIDITRLKISLNIYKYNYQLENQLNLKSIIPLINERTKINVNTNPNFYHHFYQIFNIINTYGHKSELVFHKPGKKINTDIFFDCINRNQLLWINDWDLYCISATFKRILMELPQPLIPINRINLPIKYDLAFIRENFSKIMNSFAEESNYNIVLFQLCEVCHNIIENNSVTRHTSSSLSKCLSHCLSHELILMQNKDNILIVNRFFKTILDNWRNLRKDYLGKYQSIYEILHGLPGDEDILTSYDMSHDLTFDDGEDEERVIFNTNNILTTNSRLTNIDSLRQQHTPLSSPRKQNIMTSPARRSSPIKSPTRSPRKSPKKFTKKLQINATQESQNKENLQENLNLAIQYPPQKYKFQVEKPIEREISKISISTSNNKKPVIRGRKVGELARLFEERTKGLELLKGM